VAVAGALDQWQGCSTGWIREQHVRRAQALLETTSEAVETVARRCGFTDAAALRASFAQRLGTTPTGYRLRFGDRRIG
jgi:transcriptional regulator GlxA family with amidase domain